MVKDKNKRWINAECIEKIDDFCILIVNEDKKIIEYSKGCERIEEFKRDEVIGKNPIELYSPNYPNKKDSKRYSLVLDTLEKGISYKNEICYYKTEKGKECTILYNSFPVYNSDNKVEYSVATYREISDYLEMVDTIHKIDIDKNAIKNRENNTQFTFDDIIGNSRLIKECKKKAKLVAKTDLPVMLVGATGTGKEMFAQSIHNESFQSNAPFIAVNCSAIPENLLESTLFGVVSGSFTGAKERKGLIEEAEGGTLFLDEINSMNIDVQAKLLRVLETKRYRKVGGNKEIKTNIRILSAINQSPQEAVEERRLRSDLYYRICVFQIYIPELRERKSDIITLANYFIAQIAPVFGKKVNQLSETTCNIFLKHSWEGNIRELKHVITQSLYLSGNQVHTLNHSVLPEYMLNWNEENEDGKTVNIEKGKNLRQMVEECEKDIIKKVLFQCHGNITHAAKVMGISRQNLQNKMKKHKIQKEN